MAKLEIELRIEELLRVKAKIELYLQVVSNVQDELSSKSKEHVEMEAKHPGLLQEFVDELSHFCNRRVEALGNPQKPRQQVVETPANLSEAEALAEPAKKPAQVQPNLSDEPTDPLKFLLKWRHLEAKKVRFKTPNGEVDGTVRGMITPFLKIETDTGYEVNVKPQDCQVL